MHCCDSYWLTLIAFHRINEDDYGMNTQPLARRTTAELLRWELAWISVEILGVAAGLSLMLGTPAVEFGGTVLFSVCIVSLLIRVQHYAVLRR